MKSVTKQQERSTGTRTSKPRGMGKRNKRSTLKKSADLGMFQQTLRVVLFSGFIGLLWIEPEATSTYENLLYSKRIMEKMGFKSAVIVTHHFHGSRSLDISNTVHVPQAVMSTTSSEALFLPYHEARETLAYTKWMLTK